jgi:hypothetical protein
MATPILERRASRPGPVPDDAPPRRASAWLGAAIRPLAARGGRHQFGIVACLITIIPLLGLYTLWGAQFPLSPAVRLGIAATLILLVLVGYVIMAKFFLTIVKLRRYLADMVSGELRDRITLLDCADDVTAIETRSTSSWIASRRA